MKWSKTCCKIYDPNWLFKKLSSTYSEKKTLSLRDFTFSFSTFIYDKNLIFKNDNNIIAEFFNFI